MSGRKKLLREYRKPVQYLFVIVSLYIGWKFVLFYNYVSTYGLSGSPVRPSGVEAFLPVSALVGFRSWLGTGVFDYIHPAGLTVFLAALAISFLFRKSFCSWICPFGLLEEYLGRAGVRLGLQKKLKMPRWLDILLRSIKYILLAFFTGSVFLLMSPSDAASFMQSPYNIIADIKMLEFFLNISLTGVLVFGVLAVMSILFDHFWCRYLCPYGALLGLLGWFSPAAVSRREEHCTGCQACDHACPGRLKVSSSRRVISPECHSCLNCVQHCPVDGALGYSFAGFAGFPGYTLPLAVLLFWTTAVMAAKAFGLWDSTVTTDQVLTIYSYMK